MKTKKLQREIQKNNQKLEEWTSEWDERPDTENFSLKENQDFFKKGIKLLDEKKELFKQQFKKQTTN